MEWVQSSGRGVIFTRVVVRAVDDDAFADEVPYVLAIVELEEGPHFAARIVGCEPDQAVIGTPVEVGFLDSEAAQHTLPLFFPRSDA